jgi:hypothetical protein
MSDSYYLLFFVMILFVAPLVGNMTQSTEPAICSLPDILMTFNNPNIAVKEYFCHSF